VLPLFISPSAFYMMLFSQLSFILFAAFMPLSVSIRPYLVPTLIGDIPSFYSAALLFFSSVFLGMALVVPLSSLILAISDIGASSSTRHRLLYMIDATSSYTCFYCCNCFASRFGDTLSIAISRTIDGAFAPWTKVAKEVDPYMTLVSRPLAEF
jgi:hypothetical protein